MQDAPGRGTAKAMKIKVTAKRGLLAGGKRFPYLYGLGVVDGADLGDLMTLVRGQLEEILLARREKEETSLESALNLSKACRLVSGEQGEDAGIATALVAGQILDGGGCKGGIQQPGGGHNPDLGPALGADGVDARILNRGKSQIPANFRLIQQDGKKGDGVGICDRKGRREGPQGQGEESCREKTLHGIKK